MTWGWACENTPHMPKTIQIRNVPHDLYRKLKTRAALEGMSVSDFLLADLERNTARPTSLEIRERLRRRSSCRPALSPADAVRAEREGR